MDPGWGHRLSIFTSDLRKDLNSILIKVANAVDYNQTRPGTQYIKTEQGTDRDGKTLTSNSASAHILECHHGQVTDKPSFHSL